MKPHQWLKKLRKMREHADDAEPHQRLKIPGLFFRHKKTARTINVRRNLEGASATRGPAYSVARSLFLVGSGLGFRRLLGRNQLLLFFVYVVGR